LLWCVSVFTENNRMKNKKLLIVLLLSLVTTPAYAGSSWVEQFLMRYRPVSLGPEKPPTRPSIRPAAAAEGDSTLAALQQGGPAALTIQDMLRLMLENNLDVNANALPPQTAQFLINTFYQPFDPSLRISATVGRTTLLSTSLLTGAPTLSTLSDTYSIGYGQTLLTGTSVGVNWLMTRTSSNNSFLLYNPSYNGALQYTLSQHLLRDRSRGVNAHQIRVAQFNQKISAVQFEQQLVDLVTQAETTYWNLVYAQEDIKVKARSRDLAQKTLEDNKIQADVGLMAPLDVVQAESEAATREVDLIKATYAETQVQDQVKKVISNSPDLRTVMATLNPIDRVRPPSPDDVMPLDDAIRYALENRPELRSAELQKKNADVDVEYTTNHLKPILDFNASYTQNGTGGVESIRAAGFNTPVSQVIPGGFGDALGQMFGYGFNSYAVGFTLQVPLRKRSLVADRDRAVSTQRTTQAQAAATAQQIALQVRNALSVVEMNRAQITAAQKARDLAEQRLNGEELKLQVGVSTSFFVLQYQRDLAAAEETELQSVIGYMQSLIQFDQAIGRTLKRNSIEIDKVQPKAPGIASQTTADAGVAKRISHTDE
jgi:outer membrane protein